MLIITNCTFWNKFQWDLKQNVNFFIQQYMHLNMSFAKCQPFCLCLNVFKLQRNVARRHAHRGPIWTRTVSVCVRVTRSRNAAAVAAAVGAAAAAVVKVGVVIQPMNWNCEINFNSPKWNCNLGHWWLIYIDKWTLLVCLGHAILIDKKPYGVT